MQRHDFVDIYNDIHLYRYLFFCSLFVQTYGEEDVSSGSVHRYFLRYRQTDQPAEPDGRGERPVWSHPHAVSRPTRPEERLSCPVHPAPLLTGPPSVAQTQPQRWVLQTLLFLLNLLVSYLGSIESFKRKAKVLSWLIYVLKIV